MHARRVCEGDVCIPPRNPHRSDSLLSLEKNLPVILESLAAEIRMKADSKYKCELLKGSKIEDKECS